MKTMKQRLVDGMQDGAVKVAGNLVAKAGESAIDNGCWFFAYEAEIPEALLKEQPKNKI